MHRVHHLSGETSAGRGDLSDNARVHREGHDLQEQDRAKSDGSVDDDDDCIRTSSLDPRSREHQVKTTINLKVRPGRRT